MSVFLYELLRNALNVYVKQYNHQRAQISRAQTSTFSFQAVLVAVCPCAPTEVRPSRCLKLLTDSHTTSVTLPPSGPVVVSRLNLWLHCYTALHVERCHCWVGSVSVSFLALTTQSEDRALRPCPYERLMLSINEPWHLEPHQTTCLCCHSIDSDLCSLIGPNVWQCSHE